MSRVWTFEHLRAKYLQWYFQAGRMCLKGATPHKLFTYPARALYPGLLRFAVTRGWVRTGDVCIFSWERFSA